MTAKKTAPPAPGAPPPVLAEIAGSLQMFGDAAVITREQWQRGGVEILLANEKFAALTGYPAAGLPGQNTRLLHGQRTDLLALGAASDQRLAEGDGWLYRKDGSEFYAAWSFTPILRKGQPSGCLFGVYRDISETRRLREALVQSQKLVTAALLAGGVTHDFNNLLSVINGYCEILATKLAGVPAAQKDLQEIHRAGLKASALTRQILEYSRRPAGEARVVNFNTLIREIAEIIRRLCSEEIAVELRLASDLGNVRIDPLQFQQVLLNLCINARDAMPRGGKLTIRTWNHRVGAAGAGGPPELADGLYAALQVTDTGHGMEPDTLRKIFEPYYTTKSHGTGLGLTIVHGIIRENHGHITARSTRGAGTTFEVYLQETPEPEQASVTKLDTLPSVRGSETLLIVEEDMVLRKMISGILATDGYSVADAPTPATAAALVARGLRPHLVLIQSCTKEGGELVRRLHAANPRIRLICTSAKALPVSLHEVPRTATIHLPKPFALSTLVRGVRSLLDAGGS